MHVLREALDEFSLIFYVAVNSNPEAFCLHSRRMEERAQSMLLLVGAVRTSTLDNISRALYMAVCGIFGLLSAAGALDDESSSSSRIRVN